MTWNWGSSTSGKMETALGLSTHLYQISLVVKPTKNSKINKVLIRPISGENQRNPISVSNSQLSISIGQSWLSSGKYLRFMGHDAVMVILRGPKIKQLEETMKMMFDTNIILE
jgi:hypothetical protein